MKDVMALYQGYIGTGMIAILFLCAIFYMLIVEKDRNVKIVLVYMPIVILVLYFNPLFAKVIYALAGEEIYYRILWLLPVIPVIAGACVRLILQVKEKYRAIMGITLAAILMLSGSLVYRNAQFSIAENPYHVPQVVVDICDAIEVEGREVMAVFPEELLQYVRQYSAVVCMPYGREQLVDRWGFYDNLYREMEEEVIDVERVSALAKERMCHYVILEEDQELKGKFEDYEYSVYTKITGYIIYVDNTIYRGL